MEPIFELASPEAQTRMLQHCYVRGLYETAKQLGAVVLEQRLLEYSVNPLNPSGVLILAKPAIHTLLDTQELWRCPLTNTAMSDQSDVFYADHVGIAYPKIRGIALLRPEHAILASKLEK